MSEKADVVICGAGIAGVSAAYHLAVGQRLRDVVLVDHRPPLTLTSDKSTEAYRNWWPGPGDDMVRFMNHSIDLLEALAAESDNVFQMNRRGYAFFTADPAQARIYQEDAEQISALGAGPLRVHPGAEPYDSAAADPISGTLTGADLVLDPTLIHQHFPFVNSEAVALLHPRRCGWLSAQQLGAYLLREARACGVRFHNARVTDVDIEKGRVTAARLDDGTVISTSAFVNAAGPLLAEVGKLVGVPLPVFNELHGKISFEDYLGVVPRSAPLVIWSDPTKLVWSEEERAELAADEETRWLVETFPPGVHFRPEGGEDSQILLGLWTYDVETMEPEWPPHFEPFYPEIVLRGLARLAPGLAPYIERPRKVYVDGGYYCKTRENRPLISPLPVDGAFVIGALSGYGIMASQAAGELLASYITGSELPDYAPAFHLGRYQDRRYQALLPELEDTGGQL